MQDTADFVACLRYLVNERPDTWEYFDSVLRKTRLFGWLNHIIGFYDQESEQVFEAAAASKLTPIQKLKRKRVYASIQENPGVKTCTVSQSD